MLLNFNVFLSMIYIDVFMGGLSVFRLFGCFTSRFALSMDKGWGYVMEGDELTEAFVDAAD